LFLEPLRHGVPDRRIRKKVAHRDSRSGDTAIEGLPQALRSIFRLGARPHGLEQSGQRLGRVGPEPLPGALAERLERDVLSLPRGMVPPHALDVPATQGVVGANHPFFQRLEFDYHGVQLPCCRYARRMPNKNPG
jgi:hypothetical protein